MPFWHTVLVWFLSVSQHAAQTFLRPGHDRGRRSSSDVGQHLTTSSEGANGVVALLHVAEKTPDPAEDDFVFAACVRLRKLRLSGPDRPANVSTDAKMTVAMCANRCKAHKSIHFALGGGNSCLCFDHFDAAPHGDDPATCETPCAGDAKIKCGGQGEPQPLQVYTYAHHAIEPEKDAIWLCGDPEQPKGSAKVTGDGMLRSLTCSEGYVPSEPGGAQLLCDADMRKWVPEGACISLAEALKKAKGKLSAAMEAAKAAQEKADKAEIDAAQAGEKARKAQRARVDARNEAARLSRVACDELTSAAPKVEVAKKFKRAHCLRGRSWRACASSCRWFGGGKGCC